MTQQTTLTTRAWIELILLALAWGGSFLAIRTALDEIGPLTSVFHRTFWAMIVLWLIVWISRVPVKFSIRLWGAFFGMGLLNNVIPFSLMAWGQLHISTGLTSIFNAATAVFGIVVAALVFPDEKLTSRKLTGVGLGFAGVCTAIGASSLMQIDTTSLAQLAVIAGTVSYALAGAWGRKTLSGVAPTVAAAGMLTGSTVLIVPVTLFYEGVPSFRLDYQTWLAIGYYALIATALAYLLYYRVLAIAGSGNLLLVTLLIPPVAITLGAWFRSETLEPGDLIGFALLALGLLIVDGRILRRFRRSV